MAISCDYVLALALAGLALALARYLKMLILTYTSVPNRRSSSDSLCHTHNSTMAYYNILTCHRFVSFSNMLYEDIKHRIPKGTVCRLNTIAELMKNTVVLNHQRKTFAHAHVK